MMEAPQMGSQFLGPIFLHEVEMRAVSQTSQAEAGLQKRCGA